MITRNGNQFFSPLIYQGVNEKCSMKDLFVVLFVIVIISVGCDSDSNLDSRSFQGSPVGPTQTLDVPGTYASIQAAINAAGVGDFIRVAAGVYSENILIKSKSISLRGAGIGQSIILGSVKINNASETSFEGFTVKGGGIHVRNSSPARITGNEIIDSPSAGLWLENSSNVVASDNIIRNNGKEGILIDDSSGVIGSTTVADNKTDGIVINNSSPTLLDNAVTSNARDGIAIRGFTSYSAPLLLANVVRDNGGASNYDIICFGENTNPTGVGNTFERCINCAECRSFGDPMTFQD